MKIEDALASVIRYYKIAEGEIKSAQELPDEDSLVWALRLTLNRAERENHVCSSESDT